MALRRKDFRFGRNLLVSAGIDQNEGGAHLGEIADSLWRCIVVSNLAVDLDGSSRITLGLLHGSCAHLCEYRIGARAILLDCSEG
ncbi:hypothetical protein D3C86_1918200 [compost metagenome]